MIDFRYHLVSIVAVFLALATGLLLGSTSAVQEVSQTVADKSLQYIQKNNDELRAQVTAQDEQLAGQEQYAQVTGPTVLADRLKDSSVVFVLAPGASEQTRTGLDAAVKSAGGTVSGWVSLTDAYLADGEAEVVDQLAEQLKPTGLTYPEDANAYAKAAALLAHVLVTKDTEKAGHEDVASGAVLEAFKQAGLLTTSGNPAARATLALLVAPGTPYAGDGAETDNNALVALAGSLDGAGQGTVVAGNTASAESGGLLSALRSAEIGERVSSVDTADTATGQIVGVLALNVEMNGESGEYGTGSGVSGFLPDPLPPVPADTGARP
ncbi:copper transport outer membrane protein MctB [Actinocorallia herbida]|uniref:Copper transport outer membrane protein MctB n=1 Tax=Actinocorallia herbida TaxID=58109 RepID=A0A3N1CS09_9ACTN|nr:copper transporter [Actinocorallia herbida]ROO84106.1 copper transport outer membrane protein MctB [Actinocorallia herbida]